MAVFKSFKKFINVQFANNRKLFGYYNRKATVWTFFSDSIAISSITSFISKLKKFKSFCWQMVCQDDTFLTIFVVIFCNSIMCHNYMFTMSWYFYYYCLVAFKTILLWLFCKFNVMCKLYDFLSVAARLIKTNFLTFIITLD